MVGSSSTKRRFVLAGALAGAATLGVRLALHQAATSIKGRPHPQLDPLYDLPPDVSHLQVPAPDGGSLHVVERGQGRPMVLVHGITLQASVWAPQLHLLADRYRILAMDVRGHGSSTAGRDGYGRKVAARDLAAVIEHLDLEGAVLVGHSMGGMIVMELAADFPELLDKRVAGLVFMDTAAYRILPKPALPLVKLIGRRLDARLATGKRVPQRRFGDDDLSWVLARIAFGRRPPTKAVGQVRQFLEQVPQATSLPSGIDLLDHDAREALRSTRTPSLVMVGSLDLLTPVPVAKKIARFLPGARFEVIAGAGHQLMQERPHEVCELLDSFARSL